jgi:hypothetical protein
LHIAACLAPAAKQQLEQAHHCSTAHTKDAASTKAPAASSSSRRSGLNIADLPPQVRLTPALPETLVSIRESPGPRLARGLDGGKARQVLGVCASAVGHERTQ